MNKLMMIAIAACAAAFTGCSSAPKVRDVDVKGMYLNGYTEVLAIGRGTVTSIPSDKEALAAHYEEDTAWLSPSTKTHALDLFLVGTNTVENSKDIVKSICGAVKEGAPTVSCSQNTTGSSVLTYFGQNPQASPANEALKLAGTSGSTNAVESLVGKIGAALYAKFAAAGGDASKAVVTTTTAADGTTITKVSDGSACVECQTNGNSTGSDTPTK